eukprot:6003372-Pyramimonas_sp.AAC.2
MTRIPSSAGGPRLTSPHAEQLGSRLGDPAAMLSVARALSCARSCFRAKNKKVRTPAGGRRERRARQARALHFGRKVHTLVGQAAPLEP